tara:strand:- start:3789 stop:4001 length:213 start_codon:yes stop_codon:yes gene_type:complete
MRIPKIRSGEVHRKRYHRRRRRIRNPHQGKGYVSPDGQLFTNIADCEKVRYTGSYRHCVDTIRINEGMWH